MKRCRNCGEPFWPERDYHHTCPRCFRAGRRRSSPVVTISDQLLKRTIALCHPDRHPGREQEATAVTAELIQLRAQLDRAA